MSKEEDRKYWFPAKTYGWGWGLPTSWKGWLTFAFYASFLVSDFFIFPPDRKPTLFLVAMIVDSALLIATCWRTGAPTKWRWGK